jgi:hypothetical protein
MAATVVFGWFSILRFSSSGIARMDSGLVARVLEFDILDKSEPARWAPRRRFTRDKKPLFLSEFPRSATLMTIATIDLDGGRHYNREPAWKSSPKCASPRKKPQRIATAYCRPPRD